MPFVSAGCLTPLVLCVASEITDRALHSADPLELTDRVLALVDRLCFSKQLSELLRIQPTPATAFLRVEEWRNRLKKPDQCLDMVVMLWMHLARRNADPRSLHEARAALRAIPAESSVRLDLEHDLRVCECELQLTTGNEWCTTVDQRLDQLIEMETVLEEHCT